MKIVIDTREQAPFAFRHGTTGGVFIEPGTLDTGDYPLADRLAGWRGNPSLPMGHCVQTMRHAAA